MSGITILTATALEQRPLRERLGNRFAGHDLCWAIGGMGAGATAYATLKAIRDSGPELIILAGIAGALPLRHVEPGDVLLVGSDHQADLGAWRPETGGFEPFGQRPEAAVIGCPYTDRFGGLFRVVPGRSVNMACAPLPIRDGEAVESMEGAAFFAVCTAEGVPFLQLRAISNRVGDSRAEWQVPRALGALADGVERLIGAVSLPF